MRILIGGFGSRGDMQPMLALGLALRARGHEVTMCGPPDFAAWADELAMPFAAVGGSVEELVRRGTNRAGNVRTVTVLREARTMGHAHFAALEPLVARSDLVVASGITVAGASLAEKCGIPYVFVGLCPEVIPSREHPHPMVARQTLPPWMNRLSWRIGAIANNLVFRAVVNRERARLGLAPIGDVWEHVIYHRLTIAADPALAPLPNDAPDGVQQTAALFMPEPEDLPEEVEAFLLAGPPPVYIGFGSMPDQDPARTSRRILEAVRKAGVRVLLSSGWAGLGRVELPPTALVIGHTPHGKLFPCCAAVVHHGGAGTTANAARSGVPQVLVPHFLDQFFWCHRVWQLGLSPPPIPRSLLQVEPLAAALRACLEDTALRERARAFAPTVALDGLDRTVRFIEAA
jgi:UDP:flavonoid glycosyltransferase YjiC (YdhE family)